MREKSNFFLFCKNEKEKEKENKRGIVDDR